MRCCKNTDYSRNTLILDDKLFQQIKENYIQIISKVVARIPEIDFSPMKGTKKSKHLKELKGDENDIENIEELFDDNSLTPPKFNESIKRWESNVSPIKVKQLANKKNTRIEKELFEYSKESIEPKNKPINCQREIINEIKESNTINSSQELFENIREKYIGNNSLYIKSSSINNRSPLIFSSRKTIENIEENFCLLPPHSQYFSNDCRNNAVDKEMNEKKIKELESNISKAKSMVKFYNKYIKKQRNVPNYYLDLQDFVTTNNLKQSGPYYANLKKRSVSKFSRKLKSIECKYQMNKHNSERNNCYNFTLKNKMEVRTIENENNPLLNISGNQDNRNRERANSNESRCRNLTSFKISQNIDKVKTFKRLNYNLSKDNQESFEHSENEIPKLNNSQNETNKNKIPLQTTNSQSINSINKNLERNDLIKYEDLKIYNCDSEFTHQSKRKKIKNKNTNNQAIYKLLLEQNEQSSLVNSRQSVKGNLNEINF